MITPAASKPWFVAVGASGREGLDDILALLGALEPGRALNAVVMVVLHRPFDRPSNLRAILQRATAMPVHIAEQGDRVERGCCYIGEPAAHLTLLGETRASVTADPQRLARNRTVDLLFKSIASEAGAHGIGVVLSGSLDDGSRGIAAIHDAGGQTMVLLRNSHPAGMPENAIGYDGPIDCIGSSEEIAQAIQSLISQ